MSSFLEDIFGGGYDPDDEAKTSLTRAGDEANAQNAVGSEVNPVDMGANGAAGQAAASDAAAAAGGARSQAQGAAGAAGLSGAAAANAGAGAGASQYGSTLAAIQPQLTGQQTEANIASAANKTNASMTNTQTQAQERGQNLDYAQGMAYTGMKNAQNIQANESGVLSGLGAMAGKAGPMVGGIAGTALSVLSDRRAKTNIDDGSDILSSVAKSIRGHKFSYKSSPSQGEYGVMAQDLEKTPLANTVQEGQDGMKRIDAGKLTTANTAMISDLSRKLDKALEYMGRVK
jgi:hypothetical protein